MLNNRTKIILGIALGILVLCIGTFIGIKIATRKIDVSQAKHGVTIEDNVDFYKKTKLFNVKIHKELDLGTNVYVLEEIQDKDGTNWSKVVIDNKKGYILSEKIGYFNPKEEGERVLMVDVSKFNKGSDFETGGEFGAFIINNNISYVYVRAGGRGYGTEGNFYTDTEYKVWTEECEFLDVPFGFYFLDEALNSEEIDEEVDFIKKFLDENKYENRKLPVALDIESHEGGRSEEHWEERAIFVAELVQKLENSGVKNIIYSNANTASEFLGTVPAKFWLAYYPEGVLKVPTKWYSELGEEIEPTLNEELMSKMIGWQFTESGVGAVIPHSVDISLIEKNFFE